MARTPALVAQYFVWPGLARDVEAYVRSCNTCARNKVVRHAPYGLLSPLSIPTRPWSSMSLDWMLGPLHVDTPMFKPGDHSEEFFVVERIV